MARDRASRPEAKPLRLFVAADVPEEVRRAVETAVAPLRKDFPKARWVPPHNWHVTLKFLGSTWPRLVDWVVDSVAAVAAGAEAFESGLVGVGAFPSERRARVLWAGLADPDGRLGALADALEAALEREFPRERRAFAAHLTVARFDPLVPLGELLAALEVAALRFRIDHLTLYQSHLRRPAPLYEALRRFPLGPGAGA